MFKEINGFTIDFKNKLVWGLTQEPRSWSRAMNLEKDGWRLPTRDELKQAFIDKVPGFAKDRFWSSLSLIKYINYAWYVHLGYGFADYDNKALDYYVRCVRPLDSLILKELNFTMEIL